jgi:hypothetical protein
MLIRMKRKNILRTCTAVLAVSILVTGCTPNEEDPITLPRDKFIGTWHMTSHHSDPNQAATQYWDLVIEAASAAAAEQVVMKNFDQTGTNKTVYADVNGSNLSIPGTVVYLDGGGQQTIEGSGNLNNATLSFVYTSFDGLATDSATASGTK